MDFLKEAVGHFLHLDRYLNDIITQYGTQTYIILFLILFAETGLVVTPFLPGDSLLFAAGTIAGTSGNLNLWLLYVVLFAGALVGDNVNYFAGKFLGPRLFKNEQSRFFKKAHLDRTHTFFERYGGKTIIIARFVPIVRTFAPFVAGLGAMRYRNFILYSLAGAALWVGICVTAGYYFGKIEFVQKNFTVAVLAVVLISVLPAIYEIIKHRREVRTPLEEGTPDT
jgi:membrane-associated protein